MKLNTSAHSNVRYLSFDIFDKTGIVRHAFSTRIGGVSGEPNKCFESLNLWFGSCSPSRDVRDERDNVRRNIVLFSEAVGFDARNMVFSDQVHGTNLACVGARNRGVGFLTENELRALHGSLVLHKLIEIDGLLTDEANVVLTTFYADCTPLYFLDPTKKVIALAHAGWKGTLGRMAECAVVRMNESYGCKPRDILCGIGPAIGGCCYDVDTLLTERFLSELPTCAKYISGRYIDLKMINRQILLDAGIPAENIEVSEHCTKCNPNLFYSHRGMGGNRGQMAAVLELIR